MKDSMIPYPTHKKFDTQISHKQAINSINNIFSRKYSKEHFELKKTSAGVPNIVILNEETEIFEESYVGNMFQRTFLKSSENHVTVKRLVDYLTTSPDHGNFMTPLELMDDVILRFLSSLGGPDKMEKFSRVRIFVALRHWLTNYWDVDFCHSKHLFAKLRSFLFCTGEFESITETDNRIIQNLQDIMLSEINKSQTNKHTNHSNFESESKNERGKLQISNSIFRGLKYRHTLNFRTAKTSERRQVINYLNNAEVQKSTINQELVTISMSAYEGKISEKNIELKGIKGWSNLTNSLKNFQTPLNFAITNGYHYDSDEIAKQFCLLEQNLICHVSWMQLLDIDIWTQKRISSPILDESFVISRSDQETWNTKEGIRALIDRSNLTSNWVIKEIIHTSLSMNTSDCVKLVEKYIQIAQRCYFHNNFSTLMQIVLALQNSLVENLSKVWAKVSSGKRDVLNKLINVTSPLNNFKILRERLHAISDEIGSEHWMNPNEKTLNSIVPGVTSAIPFTGLFLKDLEFTFTQPDYINEDEVRNQWDKIVNFRKQQLIAVIIRRFRSFQAPCRLYDFKHDVDLYHLIFELRMDS
ncbi:Guanine nucleotide exchange factor lte1 [Nowakowskiella sp. JEL0078]|nr:Guanine nucleotide exchange factor lte1 [Nowakowskiella sp. JEL0078]